MHACRFNQYLCYTTVLSTSFTIYTGLLNSSTYTPLYSTNIQQNFTTSGNAISQFSKPLYIIPTPLNTVNTVTEATSEINPPVQDTKQYTISIGKVLLENCLS